MNLKEQGHFHTAVQMMRIKTCQEKKRNQFKKSKILINKISENRDTVTEILRKNTKRNIKSTKINPEVDENPDLDQIGAIIAKIRGLHPNLRIDHLQISLEENRQQMKYKILKRVQIKVKTKKKMFNKKGSKDRLKIIFLTRL